jgi:hypothetical protein
VTELDIVEQALQRARAELSAPSATLERVWQRLPPPSPLGAAPATPSGWAALKATGTSGAIAAAALVGGGFVLGFWARDARDARSELPLASPALVAATPVATPAPLERPPESVGEVSALASPEPAPSNARPAAPARRAVPPSAPSDGTPQELALLARVERALRNDDAALALALLAELEQRFPKTMLDEERTAARLMSHCIQKRDGAAPAARAFLSEHRASVYASRLRAVCELGTAQANEQDGDHPLTGSAAPDTDGP